MYVTVPDPSSLWGGVTQHLTIPRYDSAFMNVLPAFHKISLEVFSGACIYGTNRAVHP